MSSNNKHKTVKRLTGKLLRPSLKKFGKPKESLYKKRREITKVNFSITSRCNRACPDCSYGMQNEKMQVDLTLEQIKEYAQYFQELDTINITGGEPSFHKNFKDFSEQVRSIFSTHKLTIETNGYAFIKNPELFLSFDEVYVSNYDNNTYDGCQGNQKEIKFMQEYLKGKKTEIILVQTLHLNKVGKGGICARGLSENVSFFKGLIYPCCTGQGVPGAIGLIPCSDWREKILKIPLPCKNCIFSI